MRWWWLLRRKLKDLWWWPKYRLMRRHQYHIMRTGLKPGYHDPDFRITSAVFEEVCYFRRECDMVDWMSDPGHELAWKSVNEAADWWVSTKKAFYNGSMSPDEENAWSNVMAQHFAAIGRALPYMWYP